MNAYVKNRLIAARTRYYLSKSLSARGAAALEGWNYWSLLAARAARTAKEAQEVYHICPSVSKGQKIAWRKMRPLFKKDRLKTSATSKEVFLVLVVRIKPVV